MRQGMIRGLRANLLGLVAIFIALGGVAVALQKDSVKSRHIKNQEVKTPDIKPGAVKSNRIKDGAVGPDQEADRERTIAIGPAQMKPVSSSPAAEGTTNGTAPALTFGGSTQDRAVFSFPVPDDWDGESNFVVSLLWTAVATTGHVVWAIEYQANQAGEEFSSSSPTSTQLGLSSAPASPFDLRKHSMAIDAGDIDPGDEVIMVGLFRVGDEQFGNDSMSGTAILGHVEVTYQASG